MSLLDIHQAKEALTWRLREWGCDEPAERATSFIDDLVQKGWRMDATREDRPQPPKADDACRRCGQQRGDCHCTREQLATDYERDDPNPRPPTHADASLARALMAQTKGSLCGCGVKRELCPTHRAAEEVGHE